MPRVVAVLFAMLCSTVAWAGDLSLAVLPLEGDLSLKERQLITDEIRLQAADMLKERGDVLTRENQDVLLQFHALDAACSVDGTCALEIGRYLQQGYVITGEAVAVADEVLVTLILVDTASGALLNRERTHATSTVAVLERLREPTAKLIAVLGVASGVTAPTYTEAVNEPLSPIPARAPAPSAPPQAPAEPPPVAGADNTDNADDGGEARDPAEPFDWPSVTGELQSPTLGTLVCLSPGSFPMGSRPGSKGHRDRNIRHDVTLTKGVCVMEREVTQGAWDAFEKRNRSKFKKCGPTCPISKTSWFDAVAFANKVSQAEGLQPAYTIDGDRVSWDASANGYRLPTEAEWSMAAHGGVDHRWAGAEAPEAVAWFNSQSGREVHEGCLLARNGYGLCDMSGNVTEWVWDGKSEFTPSAAVDPVFPPTDKDRTQRGGHYDNGRDQVRITQREHHWGTDRWDQVGFRLVRNAP